MHHINSQGESTNFTNSKFITRKKYIIPVLCSIRRACPPQSQPFRRQWVGSITPAIQTPQTPLKAITLVDLGNQININQYKRLIYAILSQPGPKQSVVYTFLAYASPSRRTFLGDSPPVCSGSSSALRLPLEAAGASAGISAGAAAASGAAFASAAASAASGLAFLRTMLVRSTAPLDASATRACVCSGVSPRTAPKRPPRTLASGAPRSSWGSMGFLRRSTS